MVVIHPGVDSTWYSPDPGTPRAAHPAFLYLGRLKRYKGVEYALRALAAARQVRNDMTLDICGQGDDRARLEGITRTLGLGEAVRFLGFVSDDQKRTLLRRAWAVVFPSPKEGWGISNVEAAACGTPALASDSPGLRESVRHGVTGYLVSHGDARGLADRMLELASDPGLVSRLGAAARTFAQGLSWDTLKEKGWQRLNVPSPFAPFARGNFPTPSGKCEFYSQTLADQGLDPLPTFIPPRESAARRRDNRS